MGVTATRNNLFGRNHNGDRNVFLANCSSYGVEMHFEEIFVHGNPSKGLPKERRIAGFRLGWAHVDEFNRGLCGGLEWAEEEMGCEFPHVDALENEKCWKKFPPLLCDHFLTGKNHTVRREESSVRTLTGPLSSFIRSIEILQVQPQKIREQVKRWKNPTWNVEVLKGPRAFFRKWKLPMGSLRKKGSGEDMLAHIQGYVWSCGANWTWKISISDLGFEKNFESGKEALTWLKKKSYVLYSVNEPTEITNLISQL